MAILIAHGDVAIYIVLLAQVTLSLLRGQPHTLVALFVHGAPRGYVPSVVLLSLGVLTRRLQRGYHIAPGRGHALLAVQDMESGIPAVELPSLFARFHRGSGVPAEGSGLGLAIAHVSVRSSVSTIR